MDSSSAIIIQTHKTTNEDIFNILSSFLSIHGKYIQPKCSHIKKPQNIY